MADLTPEQIAANELQATKDAELKTQSKAEALRELSKELGINAFEPSELKAKFDEYNTWKTSQKSEQELLQEQLDLYKTKEETWTAKELGFNSQLKASELGISQDNLEDALKLAGGDPSKLAEVVKKYPAFKSTSGVKIGVQDPVNNQNPNGLSEAEIYMKSNPGVYGAKK